MSNEDGGEIIYNKDEQIKQDILKALFLHKLDKKSKIDIEVEKGWVSLDGHVIEPWVKERIEFLANNILGVSVIINKIAVVPSDKKEDIQIARQIIDDLDKNEIINVEKISVRVNRNMVELNGNVTSWKARDEAVRIAESINKVINVKEEIKVTA